MSNREKAVAIIDSFADNQLDNVIVMLQTMKRAIEDARTGETPNAATIAAIQELENDGGELWTGSTEDFFAMLDAEVEGNELRLARTGTHSDLFG